MLECYINCYHFLGPMLMFEKFSRGRRVKTFYACAASRNRKGCHAYVVKGDHEKKVFLVLLL